MTYCINRILPIAFDEVVTRTKAALKADGFGVLTEINVQETLKAKIGVDFPKYVILGACNPRLDTRGAPVGEEGRHHAALQRGGARRGRWQTEVAAIDPVASMQAIDNPALKQAAQVVRSKLDRVVAHGVSALQRAS